MEKEAKKRLVKDPFDDHMGKQALVGHGTCCESLQPLKSYDGGRIRHHSSLN